MLLHHRPGGLPKEPWKKLCKHVNHEYSSGKRLRLKRTCGIAEMATKIETAKLLILEAASLRQSGKPCTKVAAMAKWYAEKPATFVTDLALQIHGGYGYMKEYAIEIGHVSIQELQEFTRGTSEV